MRRVVVAVGSRRLPVCSKLYTVLSMAILLELPSIEDAQAFHLQRWEEVCADPTLRRLPDRIETNRFGQIVMMPPPGFSHTTRQSEIFAQLIALMPGGRACAECAVLTSDGVKGLDLAWITEERVERGLKGEVLTIAPEICVEVVSPSNTRQEMESKRALYFEAGADEVWICDQQGRLHFFLKGNEESEDNASSLCPMMPKQVKE